MKTINWEEFEQVELRIGTIVEAEEFPEARRPAYKLKIDFGEDIGYRKSSAQITEHYKPEDLVGKQIVGVVNFPVKQIGPFMSECLVTGFFDDKKQVVLAVPDQPIPNGRKLL
ncbi:MAG: tRNA-binding protein [Gammaproteobacteria bacterium]|nr:tRNA-binding protein [Gammaproteobacteria bacterium]